MVARGVMKQTADHLLQFRGNFIKFAMKSITWDKNVKDSIHKRLCGCQCCLGCGRNGWCGAFGANKCLKCDEYRCNLCLDCNKNECNYCLRILS